MKPRPDVVAVHDFVKDLVDSKALACRVKDECRARVTVEPDERGFGIIRSNGVDVTERVMKFIFAGPAGRVKRADVRIDPFRPSRSGKGPSSVAKAGHFGGASDV